MLAKFDTDTNLATRERSNPTALANHRVNVSAADGTTAPANNNAAWITNPGGCQKALIFAELTFTNGTNPSATIRPYLRSGGAGGSVAGCDAVTIVGTAKRAIEIATHGLDLLAWLETISGTPDATDLDTYVIWL